MLKRPLPEEARPDDVPDASTEARFPDLLAAIDIGSNSFRLELAQVKGASYKRVDYLKEAVRLGGGLDSEGMLTEAAVTRGLACLQRFAQRLDGFQPHQVRAVTPRPCARRATATPSWPAARRCWATRSRSSPAARRRA